MNDKQACLFSLPRRFHLGDWRWRRTQLRKTKIIFFFFETICSDVVPRGLMNDSFDKDQKQSEAEPIVGNFQMSVSDLLNLFDTFCNRSLSDSH